MEIFGNKINPKVFVIGVFHGDEPQGKFLIENYLKVYSDTNLLMLPCLNHFGLNNNVRVNANGVDLNRNYPTSNWELTEQNEFFGGKSPASEKETRFIIDLVEKYSPEIILTLHAPYKVVNFDGGKNGKYKNILEHISKIMKYPLEPSIGYPTPGSFGTWAGVERQISTITLELDEEVDISSLEKPVFEIFEFLEGVS